MSALDTINKRLTRIEAKLAREAWVGADDIMKATGWNKKEMYRMRTTGAIVFKKMGKTILYDANSIPVIFLRQTS
jgi:hypothetical protein